MPTTSLFNIPTNGPNSPATPQDNAAEAARPKEVGVVTSAQGTITFAVAPAAVTIVWKVLSNALPVVATWAWFPVVLSLIVGMAIYYLAPASGTAREKGIAFFFAFINSFAIAATTLGIDAATTPPASKPAETQIQQGLPSPASAVPPTPAASK